MKGFIKFVLGSAVIALIAGIVIGGIGFAANGFKGVNLIWNKGIKVMDDENLVTLEKTKLDDFTSALIDIDAGEIKFVENDKDEYAIEYKLLSDDITCDVKDSTLDFKSTYENKISIMNFGSAFEGLYLTVYYPKGATFDTITVNTSAGAIKALDSLSCANFVLDTSAGAINLDGFTGKANINSSAGGFKCNNCNFEYLVIDLSAGGVELDSCTINGGKIDMAAGGFKSTNTVITDSIDFDMSAGGVEIELIDGDDIGFKFDLSAGSATIDGQKVASMENYNENTNASVILNIDCSAGGIKITHK